MRNRGFVALANRISELGKRWPHSVDYLSTLNLLHSLQWEGNVCGGSTGAFQIALSKTEGARFWLKVFNELRSRGVDDILIAVVDGLKGLSDAIETAFPRTTVQTCVVHLIRNSLDYASCKDRKAVAAALRPIYTVTTTEPAAEALEEFARTPWGAKHPTIVQSWKRAWQNVIPFFAFAPEVRRVVYTTLLRVCTCSCGRSSEPRALPRR